MLPLIFEPPDYFYLTPASALYKLSILFLIGFSIILNYGIPIFKASSYYFPYGVTMSILLAIF